MFMQTVVLIQLSKKKKITSYLFYNKYDELTERFRPLAPKTSVLLCYIKRFFTELTPNLLNNFPG